jgi:hypothetical protein
VGYRNDPKPFTNVKDVEIDSMIMTDIYNPIDPRKDTLKTRRITYKGTPGDKINGSIISFGTGIGWSQIIFDITYEFGSYETKANGAVRLREPYEFDQTVTRKEHRIMINFTGFF